MRTIDTIYQAYEKKYATEQMRAHLGASQIGNECYRALYFTFRWAGKPSLCGQKLRLLQRGKHEEAIFIADMQAIGIQTWSVDPETGKQWFYQDVEGHFGGSLDAIASGFPEYPNETLVCEFKTHNLKSFTELKKTGVKKSHPLHYAQVQCYMYWANKTKAFYLAVNKNDDELYSEFINADINLQNRLLAKARTIIYATSLPQGISERPDWWQCKFCDYYAICHQKAPLLRNCRTCSRSCPIQNAWFCNKYNKNIPLIKQSQTDWHCKNYESISVSA